MNMIDSGQTAGTAHTVGTHAASPACASTSVSRTTGRLLAGIAALALLAACENGPFAGNGGGETGPASAQSVELVERDVEAPEVFQITEQGLWDGRPSLGGVWVAHPDVGEPERVIIRNQSNGNFVIGALFRRERDNPGPALQVSSDAAEALGLLAGSPASLNVTALRREEAATPAPDMGAPDMADPGMVPAADLSGDPAAALAGSGAITTAALDGGTAPVSAPASAPATTPPPVDAPVAVAAGPVPDSTLERPFIQLGIFSVEANAAGLVSDLTGQGLPARMVESALQGRPFWRVLVGPAGSEPQRAAYLEQVKTQGFADAYFVRN